MYLDNGFELIQKFDPQMASLVIKEEERQKSTLDLIVSENYTSPLSAGLEGSVLANKNAQGYPSTRAVGGCEIVNEIENLTCERIKKVFGCEHVNIQPLSASIANIAVFRALLNFGDTVLSLEHQFGSHITHGAKENITGQQYNIVNFGYDPKTEKVDMKEVERIALECKPKMIICGSGADPNLVDYEAFSEIAKKVGAYLLADIAHPAGLIAAGLIPSPVPFADVVTSTTHKTWRGSRGCGLIMCKKELAEKIDKAVCPGLQGAPKMDMIAARGVQALETMTPQFKAYAKQMMVNAAAFADELKKCGFRLVSGGTQNQLILVDIRSHIANGTLADKVLSSVGIVINKEWIPYDPQPQLTSGIRIGTPPLTTRGLKEEHFRKIAHFVSDALKNADNKDELNRIHREVKEMALSFPLFASEWMPDIK